MFNKTTDDLREFLFDTMKDVRNGKVDPNEAKSITGLAGAIIDSAKVDIEYAKASRELGHTTPAQLVSGQEEATKQLEEPPKPASEPAHADESPRSWKDNWRASKTIDLEALKLFVEEGKSASEIHQETGWSIGAITKYMNDRAVKTPPMVKQEAKNHA